MDRENRGEQRLDLDLVFRVGEPQLEQESGAGESWSWNCRQFVDPASMLK